MDFEPIGNKYVYQTLTRTLDDPRSPLRIYLDARFPERKLLRAEYRRTREGIRVPPTAANPATIGTAFDLLVRYCCRPDYHAIPAFAPFLHNDAMLDALHKTEQLLQDAAPYATREAETFLCRASWAMALATEKFRGGTFIASSLDAVLKDDDLSSEALLTLCPEAALGELAQLRRVAEDALFPRLAVDRVELGPNFAASERCPADADLISAGTLLELKTTRTDTFPGRMINQLVCYALFDTDDQYGIDSLAVYSARFGHYHEWPLDSALETLARGSVDIQHERAEIRRILDEGQTFLEYLVETSVL